MFNNNIPLKQDVQNEVLTVINNWLKNADFKGKVVFRSWIDERSAVIKYENQPYTIKCDLAVFLNIDEKIYRIFITFKINNFKYELNAQKKALLIQRKNGLVSYDDDGKKVFKITRKDKNAIVIFIANDISSEQTNSWKSRVLCCYADNIISTIKHQLADIKQQNNVLKKTKIQSILKE